MRSLEQYLRELLAIPEIARKSSDVSQFLTDGLVGKNLSDSALVVVSDLSQRVGDLAEQVQRIEKQLSNIDRYVKLLLPRTEQEELNRFFFICLLLVRVRVGWGVRSDLGEVRGCVCICVSVCLCYMYGCWLCCVYAVYVSYSHAFLFLCVVCVCVCVCSLPITATCKTSAAG